MTGRYSRPSIPLRDPSGNGGLGEVQIAELLADHFEDVYRSPLLSVSSIGWDSRQGIGLTQDLDRPFTSVELKDALSLSRSGTIPGIDNVPYEFVRRAPKILHSHLLHFYNVRLLVLWCLPCPVETRRSSTIGQVREGSVCPEFISAHKSASMSRETVGTSCLVHTQLQWVVETSGLLPEGISGFRLGRSTMDCLLSLEHRIMDTYRRRRVLLTAFFDIKSAFDSASHSAVLQSLARLATVLGKGLSINPVKSCVMSFTWTRLPDQPVVTVGGCRLPIATEHRWLGVVLDSPRLTWRHHVDYLRASCRRRVNIMKRLSGAAWGASRESLLALYKAFIHSKIMYASEVYGSAAASVLAMLDPIQNGALRSALGAMPSSPVLSLHAESGLWPLSFERLLVHCRQFQRIVRLPATHPLTRLQLEAKWWNVPAGRSRRRQLPFVVRALDAYSQFPLPVPVLTPGPIISSVPPWAEELIRVSVDFSKPPRLKRDLEGLAPLIFADLRASLYSGYLEVYTDGSRKDQPPSTSAAAYFAPFSFCQTWKLSPAHSCLAGELFAILLALRLLRQLSGPSAVVFYVDSVTALHLISSRRPRVHRHTVSQIRGELLSYSVTPGWSIYLQTFPSHVGIKGNEVADAAAGMAHALHDSTNVPLDLSEILPQLRAACLASWEAMMEPALRSSSLAGLLEDSTPRPWTRHHSQLLDTAITRLRIEHTCLAAHLHRLRLVDSPYCQWCPTQEDTVEHLLLHCPRFHSARIRLQSAVRLRRQIIRIPRDTCNQV
ncbi:uncharacterized protein [Procambarus clarkii]|uniref:uncharacterized protein n=1 Tax=Procambarus clarkii TaxID=6728 RepID=UPI003742A178